MSLLGEIFLDQIVKMQGITEPNIILEELHEHIVKVLHQEEKRSRDGMDATICVINRDDKTMEFSGAKRPLVYIDDQGLHQIKGDKLSLAGAIRDKARKIHEAYYSVGHRCYVLYVLRWLSRSVWWGTRL